MIVEQERMPLSFMQQRLWVLEQILPGTGIYNILLGLHLKGNLNIEVLEKAFDTLILRHEILRTTFIEEDGQVFQKINFKPNFKLQYCDASFFSEKGKLNVIQAFCETEAKQGFCLSSDSMIRVRLLRLSDNSHILFITMHHIIADGWSMEIFARELSILYGSLYNNQKIDLPTLDIQYADYAVWQRDWLTGEILDKQLNYWQLKLQNVNSILKLPFDKIRPKEMSYRGAIFKYHIPDEILESLKLLSQKLGSTLYMTLLSGFQILLNYYTNEEDIVVGSPIANRSHHEVENLIGFFVNTIVLRTRINRSSSFKEILKEVSNTCIEAYDHQDVPFEQLVDYLKLSRELNRNPLFQVMFVLQNTNDAKFDFYDLYVEKIPVETVFSRFDFTLIANENPNGLLLTFEYSLELFNEITIERIAKNYETFLKNIINNPDKPINQLQLLHKDEQQQIKKWNETEYNFEHHKLLHEFFEAFAEQYPDNMAVFCSGQALSYKTLNERSNQLAHYLLEKGIKAGDIVGVCFDKSIEFIVVILGILKTQAAYLPVDVKYPYERLKYMFEDADIKLLITEERYKGLWQFYNEKLLILDAEYISISHQSVNPVNYIKRQNDLAYLIFTSGSTGRPKGVMCTHANVCNLLTDFQKKFQLLPGDKSTLWSAVGFDVSVYEIWMPLTTGGCLHIIQEDVRTNSQQLLNYLKHHSITHAYLPAFIVRDCLEWLKIHHENLSLIYLLVGVEPIEEVLLYSLCHHLPKLQIINGYGPTETTICASLYSVPKLEYVCDTLYASIGYPVINTQIYILDSCMKPVPIGAIGELYIGGAGVSLGYINQPELTNLCFIEDPFRANCKIYKTGDLARFLYDGRIEFIGRIDEQVKLSGYRIELGEIIATLRRHEKVHDAVVITTLINQHDKLVAYIVLHLLTEDNTQTDNQGLVNELKHYLKQWLPDYMIPNYIVFLEKLPINPNGKLDRHALPTPDPSSELLNHYLAPETEIEQRLAELFSEFLKLDRVGINDNFFAMGGHSLLAIKLISRIRNLYQVDLALRQLFEFPTVVELAVQLQKMISQESNETITVLGKTNQITDLPLSFSQQRIWFLEQLLPGTPLYNILVGVRLVGELNKEALEASFQTLLLRHDILRTQIQMKDGQPIQVVSQKQSFKLFFQELSGDYENKTKLIKTYQRKEAEKTFDLMHDLLIRASLIKVETNVHVLLITLHHIIADGWSMEIIAKELALLYKCYCSGVIPDLEPLKMQYADFVLWQRQFLQGKALEKQLNYWKQQLQGITGILDLPIDKVRPKEMGYRGSNIEAVVDKEILIQIKKLSVRAGTTLYMTLLAVFQVFLNRYTSNEDIVVGSPIANRIYPNTEELIGPFINTLVIRNQIKANMTFMSILNNILHICTEAYDHQDVPFEQLVDSLQIERDISRNPLFQVMFIYEPNDFDLNIKLDGLLDEPLSPELSISKFDLTLLCYEKEGKLRLNFEYSYDLFERHTIERMAHNFECILKEIISNPDLRICELKLLTEAEKNIQVIDWNDTDTNIDNKKTIQEVFEAQVIQHPDACAVLYENESLTYQQLNSRANQLAHYLKSQGVGPEVIVAVAIERSLELIICLLGILKAGGAYVPLDPVYPEERLRKVLEDTRTTFLLTQESLLHKFDFYQGSPIVINHLSIILKEQSIKNLAPSSTYHNMAYIIYTSGSTGQPKGVQILHQAVINHNFWMINQYKFTNNDVFLLTCSVAFDASVWEIFVALSVGGCLIMTSEDAFKDPKLLLQLILEHQVTTIELAPLMLAAFLEEPGIGNCQSLKNFFVSSDVVDSEIIKIFLNKFSIVLHNLYGPTEVTVDSTAHTYHLFGDNNYKNLIGKPINNIQAYVLDPSLNLVPIGVAGELYLGGVGLARGYLYQPDITASKFIPDHFSKKPGSRLYRTGDLVRYLDSGNIEFLGRIDHQVKIRGHRIELGEIEATLREYPGIKDVVVIVREEKGQHKQLLAYFTHTDNKDYSNDIRCFVQERLPNYMVPAAFIRLDKLPITISGKLDRLALPNAIIQHRTLEVAPRTKTEKILMELWCEILNLPTVSIYDNFFQVGGDSIISIQLVSKARKRGIVFTVKQVFEAATIVGIARNCKIIEETVVENVNQEISTLVSFPLTPIQHWFFEQDFHSPHHYNQAFLLEMASITNKFIMNKIFVVLRRHHDSLRLKYYKENAEWFQSYTEWQETTSILKEIDLNDISDENVNLVIRDIIDETQKSLNIGDAKVFQAVLININNKQSQKLLLVAHHLIMDGISWRILFEDLETLYQQSIKNNELTLPPKSSSYKEWVSTLENIARQSDFLCGDDYWQATSLDIKNLPMDFNKGNNTYGSTKSISVRLTINQTQQLIHKSHFAYKTQINDLLILALILTIGDWAGNYNLYLQLEGHGREDIGNGIDISRTIGWFTSLFPIMVSIKNPEILSNSICEIKEQLRKIPQKGFGYGILRYLRNSDLQTKLAATKLPEICFNYLGQLDNSLDNSEERFFKFTKGSVASTIAPENIRQNLLEIDCQIKNFCLEVMWSFSIHNYEEETILNLANQYVENLQKIIEHCCSGVFGYSPSDFPLLNLNQTKIDLLFNKIPNIEDAYPLSPMQLGFIFRKLYTRKDEYIVQSVMELEGNLRIEHLKEAWYQVVKHHSVLRTAFLWDTSGEPIQYVAKDVIIPWSISDWTEEKPAIWPFLLKQLLKTDNEKEFDLSKPPLMRLSCIQLSNDKYYMVWTSHHILTDGWCFPIILRDLLQCYELLLNNQSVYLMPTSPYKNYIYWLKEKNDDAAKNFWKSYLQNFKGKSELTLSNNKTAWNTLNEVTLSVEEKYDEYDLIIDGAEYLALKEFARREGFTLNTLMQCGWTLLLYLYMQSEDLIFGVTISGRAIELPEVENMVGIFINTLPMRVQFSSQHSVLKLLASLQENMTMMNQYSYISLAEIQTMTQVLGKKVPLFNTLMVFENYPFDKKDTNKDSLKIKVVSGHERTEYPLTVTIIPGKKLTIRFGYQTSDFDFGGIERISKNFRNLFTQIINKEHLPIKTLNLLDKLEYQQLIVDWNQTKSYHDSCIFITRLFENQVNLTPNNVAVIYEDQKLNYQELNEQSNQLAHYLKSIGIGNETLIAITVERSIDMIIGLLGVLKAGAAYLPLDPNFPVERLQFMLNDANAKFILMHSSTKSKLNEIVEQFSGIVLSLDEDKDIFSLQPKTNPAVMINSNQLAYVIYTSGSTGIPKGVMITHHNLSNFIISMRDKFNLNSEDALVSVTTISFDIAGLEFYLPLISGARLILTAKTMVADGEQLSQLLQQHNATFLQATPAMWHLLMQSNWKANKNLTALCGGESLSENLAHELSVNCKVAWNLYGPTETTIWSCAWKIILEMKVSIGRPIKNTQVYVLNREFEPLPIGGIGELYIGGLGVARGYWGRPDLTAEKFLPNPFYKYENPPDTQSLCLYRTGDLVRYLSDGNIEFIGRLDDQVKVRGYRIELGEIEATLNRHEWISKAVVVLDQSSVLTDDSYLNLIAYVVVSESCTSTYDLPIKIKQQIKKWLPDYMVPNRIIVLKELPLTPNGKINKQALLGFSEEANYLPVHLSTEDHGKPRSEIEITLTKLYSDLLKVTHVGIYDNFFELGGHSIHTMHLVSKARENGLFFNVYDVFMFPTIAELSSHVSKAKTKVVTVPRRTEKTLR